MKTVSTLCATSTVGIAACGFALARPCAANDFNGQLTNTTVRPNNCVPPVIREPVVGEFPNSPPTYTTPIGDRSQPQSPHLFPPSHASHPSTSRRWLNRLSETFSSSSSSSSYQTSSTQSSSTTSSRSRPYTSSAFSPFSSNPNSRPPTRNKLVKRASQRHSTSGPSSALALPSQQPRPYTAVNQLSIAGQSSHLSPTIHASRPSTSTPLAIFSSRPTQISESVDSWRVFFSAKRPKSTPKQPSGASSGGGHTKLQKKLFRGVRRIYPGQRGRNNVMGPTLVLAPTMCNMDRSGNEVDAESIFSGGESLFFDSRPASRLFDSRPASRMDDLCVERPRERRSTSMSPTSRRPQLRRSLSISNFKSAPTSRNPSETGETTDNGVGDESGYVGSYGVDFGFARRYSESASHHLTRPSSPEGGREQSAPIVPLSLLELDIDPVSHDYSPDLDTHLEAISPVDQQHDNEVDLEFELGVTNLTPIPTSNRQHRLSLISVSERASTLVGSEDHNNFESDLDYQSDTVFDSMRTRLSELTPVRADTIFDIPDDIPNISPRDTRYPHKRYVSGDYTPLKQSDIATASSRNPNTYRMGFDEDEDGWGSDWDSPSKNGDDDGGLQISTQGGLRAYSGLLSAASLGLHSNNASSTSFGTAPEAFSVDGASIRETNSILDWSESVPPNTSAGTPSYAKRSKTIHAKESMLTGRAGRRAPSYHVRSQSMPLANSHARVPLSSENWDDDFLDDDDEGGFGMVIPRAIEENQASVIGHLGCVREFALLVEDLKQLREQAVQSGIRFGPHKHTFDEADGIIALATLDDDEPLPPQPAEPLPKSRNTSWNHSPSSRPSILTDDGLPKGYNPGRRRSSILSPDDDVFGGGGGGNNLTPLRHHHSFRASPTPSPASRKTIDKNDPVEVAKGIMERMQQQHQHSGSVHHVRGQSDDTIMTGKPKKVQFDTDMLRELVKHVVKLKRTLQGVVEREREVEEECRGSFEGFEDGWDCRAPVGVV